MTKEERDAIRAYAENIENMNIGIIAKSESHIKMVALLDALDKAEEQNKLLEQALSNSKPIGKIIEDFCEEEMFDKNYLCRHLTEISSKSCIATNKCPLVLFKLHIEKEQENEDKH